MYGGIYPFGSSLSHTNILALITGAEESGDVEPVPSNANLFLAMQKAVSAYAMVLMAFNQIAKCGAAGKLDIAWKDFIDAASAN